MKLSSSKMQLHSFQVADRNGKGKSSEVSWSFSTYRGLKKPNECKSSNLQRFMIFISKYPQKQRLSFYLNESQAKNLFQQFTPPSLCKTASSLLSEVGRIVLSHEDNRLMRSPGPKGYLKDHPRTCTYLEAIKRPLGRGISPSLGDETYHHGYFLHFLNGMIQVKSHRLMEIRHRSGGRIFTEFSTPFFLASNRHVVFFSWCF